MFDRKLIDVSDRNVLLLHLLQKYDEDIQMYFWKLYQLMLQAERIISSEGLKRKRFGAWDIPLEVSNGNPIYR